MGFELKQLSVENGVEEYAMLQEIDGEAYGFTNEVNGMSFDEYKAWLIRQDDWSRAQNLPENYIPQTTYFLYADGRPVGIARIRHFSSEYLEKQGVGNFGYGIAKPYRGKGYGHVLFEGVLEKCRELGYQKIRSFVHVENAASNRVFEKHGATGAGTFQGVRNIYETIIE